MSTTTPTTTRPRLTRHQREVFDGLARRAGGDGRDVCFVARTKRTARFPKTRRGLHVRVYEVGSAGALAHLAEKGYLTATEERHGQTWQTFYRLAEVPA